MFHIHSHQGCVNRDNSERPSHRSQNDRRRENKQQIPAQDVGQEELAFTFDRCVSWNINDGNQHGGS